MAASDGDMDVPISVQVVPRSSADPAAPRVPDDRGEDSPSLADAGVMKDDDSRYRDPTVLVAGATGATFTGVAISHPEVDHLGPYDGGFDAGGAGGGE